MSTNELHLDESTYARAKRMAEEKNVSIEELVTKAIEVYSRSAPQAQESASENLIGLFSDAPELMDEIVEEAYQSRERDPLRQNTA